MSDFEVKITFGNCINQQLSPQIKGDYWSIPFSVRIALRCILIHIEMPNFKLPNGSTFDEYMAEILSKSQYCREMLRAAMEFWQGGNYCAICAQILNFEHCGRCESHHCKIYNPCPKCPPSICNEVSLYGDRDHCVICGQHHSRKQKKYCWICDECFEKDHCNICGEHCYRPNYSDDHQRCVVCKDMGETNFLRSIEGIGWVCGNFCCDRILYISQAMKSAKETTHLYGVTLTIKGDLIVASQDKDKFCDRDDCGVCIASLCERCEKWHSIMTECDDDFQENLNKIKFT